MERGASRREGAEVGAADSEEEADPEAHGGSSEVWEFEGSEGRARAGGEEGGSEAMVPVLLEAARAGGGGGESD